jgi:hypothetical protein
MGGERLARAVLALDAVYCAVVGSLLVLFRARVGGLLRLPGVVVAAAGAATAASAGFLIGQAVRIDWRRGIKQTMAANAGVSMVLALAAALHPARGARVLLAFFALDVISLAVAQGVSLVRRGLRS